MSNPDPPAAVAALGRPEPNKSAEWAADNCYTLARREIRRLESWRKDGGETTPIGMAVTAWEHIIRICERAGCKSTGVLRDPPEPSAGALGRPEHELAELRELAATIMAEAVPVLADAAIVSQTYGTSEVLRVVRLLIAKAAQPPALGTLEPLPNRLRQHAHDLIHEGAVVSQLRADLFITAALIDSMLEREAARAAVRDTPQPEQEKSDVRIQPESGRVRPRLNEPTADRGMGSGAEAGHEQNCSALYFDGDYRAAVDETKCTCKKRLEAGRDTPPPQAQGEK
jgi:hypothetical protein